MKKPLPLTETRKGLSVLALEPATPSAPVQKSQKSNVFTAVRFQKESPFRCARDGRGCQRSITGLGWGDRGPGDDSQTTYFALGSIHEAAHDQGNGMEHLPGARRLTLVGFVYARDAAEAVKRAITELDIRQADRFRLCARPGY
jgi:hypothetical protein